MTESIKDRTATIMRMAGNIAASMMTPRAAGHPATLPQRVAHEATSLAFAISDLVEREVARRAAASKDGEVK